MTTVEVQDRPLFPDQQPESLDILGVTDLGPDNRGTISAADLSLGERQRMVTDIGNPRYHLQSLNGFNCVDGRPVDGGRQLPSGWAYPQLAGGQAFSETGSGMLVVGNQDVPVSEQLAARTKQAIKDGLIVWVHGDNHHHEEGCGANAKKRAATAFIGENPEGLVDSAWTVTGLLGLHDYLERSHLEQMVMNAGRNAANDALWDVTPAESIAIARQHGALYEQVVGSHSEKGLVVDTSRMAFDEEQFTKEHPIASGGNAQLFVASFGAYAAWRRQKAAKREAGTYRERMGYAVLEVAGVVLNNISIAKQLTADEADPANRLPVVILGLSS